MKKLHSQYPIGQLLITIFNESGLKLPQFLETIGYRNTAKGIRHFQEFLAEGLGPIVLITRLMQSPYAPCRNALAFVCQQNMEQIDHELRLTLGLPSETKQPSFKPFLHAVPVSPEVAAVSLVALDGEFPRYSVFVKNSVVSLPEELQYKVLGAIIRRNYHNTGGEIDCLGVISHYLYYRSWWEPPLAFSIEGELMGVADIAYLPKTETAKGSRTIDEALIRRLIHSRGYQAVH
jgi:hypothetical protein